MTSSENNLLAILSFTRSTKMSVKRQIMSKLTNFVCFVISSSYK